MHSVVDLSDRAQAVCDYENLPIKGMLLLKLENFLSNCEPSLGSSKRDYSRDCFASWRELKVENTVSSCFHPLNGVQLFLLMRSPSLLQSMQEKAVLHGFAALPL